jgi:hypothetical protein
MDVMSKKLYHDAKIGAAGTPIPAAFCSQFAGSFLITK